MNLSGIVGTEAARGTTTQGRAYLVTCTGGGWHRFYIWSKAGDYPNDYQCIRTQGRAQATAPTIAAYVERTH